MVKKEEIGTTHYSKILDRNVLIQADVEDEYYKSVGLGSVIEEPSKNKKKIDTDNEGTK